MLSETNLLRFVYALVDEQSHALLLEALNNQRSSSPSSSPLPSVTASVSLEGRRLC